MYVGKRYMKLRPEFRNILTIWMVDIVGGLSF